MIAEKGLAAWHRVVRKMSPEALDEILAEDVVFHSPVVHTPQKGKTVTKLYLMAAFSVFPGGGNEKTSGQVKPQDPSGSFQYVREVVGLEDAVLEFVTEMDGIVVNGVDMIRWNDEGKIVDFKVMVRPLKAIQKVHAQMAQMLEAMKKGA
jgi:hypothetical protein